MSDSKLLYSLLFLFCFVCSTVSSYFNTSLTSQKYKCHAQQSRALVLFKHSLVSFNNSAYDVPFSGPCGDWLGFAGYYPIMMNWNTSTDCCYWDGVTCDYSSGDIVGLDLSCGMLKGTILPNSSLFDLPRLQRLNLAFNNFSGSEIPSEIGKFSKSLTHLNISYCGITGKVPTNITLLQNLVSLDLSYNGFAHENGYAYFNYYGFKNKLGLEPHVLVNLLQNSTSLRDVRLRSVNIAWVLPTYPINISSSLNYLDLFDCNLKGSLPSSPLNLKHLTHLDLAFNELNGTLPSWLCTLPSLESLFLNGNMFSGDVPFNSSALPSLKILSLRDNQLGKMIDQDPILQLINHTSLDLSNNNFSCDWKLDSLLSSLTKLEYLDLSNSGLSITVGNTIHHVNPNLWFLSLASCKLKEFPVSLRSMINLWMLDLSSNEIHGDIPTWVGEIRGDYSLYHIDLSHNFITGLPQFHLYQLDYLNLQFNRIRGPFPPSICNMSYLSSLDLSNNRFDGEIPQWFGNFSSYLEFVNLGNNDFQGTIPNTFENCERLGGINLKNNRLQGKLPTSLSNCTNLMSIDLENNQLNDTFPNWLGGLSYLQILNLKSNKFHGRIKTSSAVEFPFESLQVLDLSHNGFVGELPAIYFQNFDSMKHVVKSINPLPQYLNANGQYFSIGISIKGMERDFQKIYYEYSIICLSHNGFEGKIPDIIGSLKTLIVLDLSHNKLTGRIPQDLGKISAIESLDLSCNQLTGEIPRSLAGLTSLEYLNFSKNLLVGPIPTGKPFDTFEGSSFEGNLHLCGPPLLKTCNENPHKPQLNGNIYEEENGFTWEVVMFGSGCGTLFGIVIGYIMLSFGRPKWYNAIVEAGERMILSRQKVRRNIVYIGK